MYTAKEIAKWFLTYNAILQKNDDNVEGISNLKLQKLLYYAQGCFLALYGEKLFEDDIVAWKHGPVVVAVYDEYKKYQAKPIDAEPQLLQELSEKAKEVLTWVYDEFGQYTAWALRNKTHEETPWKNTKPNEVILPAMISAYFKSHYVE